MNISIQERHLRTELAEDVREDIVAKLEKIEKFFNEDAQASVKLRERKNGRKIIELTIFSGNMIFRAESEDETYHNALDRDMYVIERQLRKNKTRLGKRVRENAFERTISEAAANEVIPEEGEFDIKTKSFTFKPMSVEEAILQMNLLSHDFFVFENDETHKVNVVYKRHEDKYGLIIPD